MEVAVAQMPHLFACTFNIFYILHRALAKIQFALNHVAVILYIYYWNMYIYACVYVLTKTEPTVLRIA